MAEKKLELFTQEEVRLAEIAKALSHPARIAILKTLAQKDSCICGEIVEVVPLAQSTVSQHLKELKKVGLVKGEVEGVRSCYCINWEMMDALSGQLDAFFSALKNWNQNLNCC